MGIPLVLAKNIAEKFVGDNPPYPDCHGSYDKNYYYCQSGCPYWKSCSRKQSEKEKGERKNREIDEKIKFRESLLRLADPDAKERYLAEIEELKKQKAQVGRNRQWGKRLPETRSQEERDEAELERARKEAEKNIPIPGLPGKILFVIGSVVLLAVVAIPSYIIACILFWIIGIVVDVGTIGFIIIFVVVMGKILVSIFKSGQEEKSLESS